MPEPISIITEVGEQDIILPFKYANKLNNQIGGVEFDQIATDFNSCSKTDLISGILL
jgi:hypothetical protein